MELKYKPNFNEARKYWEAFWKREILDRPPVSVTAPKEGVPQPEPEDLYMAGSDGAYEAALAKYEARAAATYFGGEALPVFDLSFGPDQFSAYLGAELVLSKEYGTSWSKPWVTDWKKFDLRLDDASGSTWAKMQAFHRAAAGYSAGKYLIALPDLHSNMDCLSAIRGPQALCMDVLDCPEEVERALSQARAAYTPLCRTLLETGDMQRRGTTSWINAYCEGRYNVIQCDFICMLSPRQARRFVIPALEEEAAFWDHSIFHYDGPAALAHLDDILAIPGIDAIQWVPGAGQPRTVAWMPVLQKIQQAGKSVWLYDWTVEEIKAYYKELRPEGVWFSVGVGSEREADELIEWFRRNT